MKINQNRVKEGICQWAKANLLLLVCTLITRAFFLLQVTHRVVIEAASFSTVASGIVFDLLLVCHIATWLLVPFLLFYCFWPNTTSKTYTGLTVFFAVVSALLTAARVMDFLLRLTKSSFPLTVYLKRSLLKVKYTFPSCAMISFQTRISSSVYLDVLS